MGFAGREIPKQRLYVKTLRPMLPLAVSTGAGLWLAAAENGVILAAAGGMLLIIVCRFGVEFRLKYMKWLLPAVYFAACGQMLLIFVPAEQIKAMVGEEPVIIRGRIVTLPDDRYRTSQVVLRLDNLARISLSAPSDKLNYGARIEVPVLLSWPEKARNPGGFSERDWLKNQGVMVKAAAVAGADIIELQPAASFSFKIWAAKQRHRVNQLLMGMTGEEAAAAVSALLLGDRTYLTLREREIFRRAGISHLAAVSGTHLAMIVLPLDILLQRFWRRKKPRALVLLLVLVCYCTIAGWPLSMTRAAIMYAAILGGRLLYRLADPLNSLACAAFIMLLCQPLSILAPGFWMSVLAAGSLVIWAKPLADYIGSRLRFIPRWLALAMSATFCAQIAVLPWSAGLSGEITLIGLVGNVLAAPLLQLLLVLSLILIPAATLLEAVFAISPEQIRLIGLPLGLAARLFSALAENLAILRIGRWQTGQVNISIWLWLYSWPVAWSGLYGRLTTHFGWSCFRASRMLAAWRCLAGGAAIAVLLLSPLFQPSYQVWFLDVGQGDAILIRTRCGKTVLIDGGKSGYGYRVIMPALDALGIDRIDLAIATHGHDDHLGGIVDLLSLRRIRELVFPRGLIERSEDSEEKWQAYETGDNSTDTLITEALDLADKFKVQVQTWHSHDTIFLNSHVRLEVLYPGQTPDLAFARRDSNALSLVIMAEAFGRKLLLTGDCTPQTEAKLLGKEEDIAADVLKVSHHGSGLSSGREFLQAVGPELAIISVGSNPYGHPAQQVLDRLSEIDSGVWRTDHFGAVTWCVWPGSWQLKTMLEPEMKMDRVE